MNSSLENIYSIVDTMLAKFGVSVEEYIASKTAEEPSSNKDADPYVSRREAASLLRCSTDTVDNLIATGKIKSSKLSSARCGRVLIVRSSLLTFVRRKTTSFKKEVRNGRR